jgi:enamine deaminase RidA (YjgF/YER057c/UK114 family)
MLDRKNDGPGSTVLLPEGWPKPRGYANGIKARGDIIFVAGQIGWDTEGKFADGFVAQARLALENIMAVLTEGKAGPEHLVRMTWYVTDMPSYRNSLRELGAAYRDVIGKNYPTMTLVGVTSLAEPKALIEIEATAVIPG